MKFAAGVLLAGLLAATALGCGSEKARPAFVHVEGDRLVDASGAPLALEGMRFGDVSPTGRLDDSEAPLAYAEVAAMGMNYVRFQFDASALEDDAAPGSYRPEALAWLDDSLARARENGLYFLLSMNIPPGGVALDCGNDAFWNSAEYQDRFVALWRMLADRYAEEPAVAGYALLDLPNPTDAIEQWQELAARATQAIREVDRQHTLYVVRAISVSCAFDEPAEKTFVRVNDANVVYEFDRAQPWFYVAQLTTPAYDPDQEMRPEYGRYPDETSFAVDQTKVKWLYTPKDTRPPATQLQLTPDESEWTKKTFYYTVTDPQFAYALPVLQADNTSGKAYFDDILIEEVSESGEARVVRDLDVESSDGWYFWEGNADGREIKGTGVVSVEKTAHRGRASVAMGGTTSYANLAGNGEEFLVDLGATYRVTSWVKGQGIAPGDSARVRLDFWGYPEARRGFDRRWLEALFTDFRAWGRTQGVPMAVSSFGTARPSFEDGRGGVFWVSDMIDIMREQQLGWAYWGYRDPDFGIYTNLTGPPDPDTINQPLVDLLTEKLH